MGAAQRLATVVMIGLVALTTILVLYMADEPNRIKAEEQEQLETSVKRGTAIFVANCVSCHGPAGEGFLTPGEQGTGRIGAPLGGDTYATALNQEALQSGTPYPGGMKARTTYLHNTIVNGIPGTKMPAWGEQLTDSQINDVVIMLQHADWNAVFNTAIETDGGYPTPPPAATQPPAEAAAAEPTTASAPAASSGSSSSGESSGSSAQALTVILGKPTEFAFDPSEFTIPADTDVTVTLKNEGATIHDFSIDALKIQQTLDAGQSATVTINAKAGEYQYYCNVPGHKEAGMVGTLTVK